MEQKRTLWILIAAGLFLCLVFGAAYFMSKSNGSGRNNNTISMGNSDLWVAPNIQETAPKVEEEIPQAENITEVPNPGEITQSESQEQMEAVNSLVTGLEYPEPGVTTAVAESSDSSDKKDDLNVYQTSESVASNGTVTTTFDFTGGSNSVATVSAANKAAEDGLKKADSQRGQMAKTLDESTSQSYTAPKVASVKETVKAASSTKPSSSTSTTVAASPKVESPKVSTSTVKTTELNAEPDRFWVQAASYSSKKKADEARSILDRNQVQCEVFTYEMNGTLYYRVRVGPYTTKTEATYWKKQVDSLEQFADAGTYIVNSSAPIAKAN